MVFLWFSHENGGFSIVNHLADPGGSFPTVGAMWMSKPIHHPKSISAKNTTGFFWNLTSKNYSGAIQVLDK